MKEAAITPDIDATLLSRILTRVHLSGLINECLLVISNGVATVRAIDLSNSVFVFSSHKMKGCKELKEFSIGLGNLGIVTKFLAFGGDYTFAVTDTLMTIKRKGRGSIRLTLMDPASVPGSVDSKDKAEEKIAQSVNVEVPITKDWVGDLQSFVGLLGTTACVVRLFEGKVSINSDKSEEHHFNLAVAKDVKSKDPVSIQVYADHLLRVLSMLEMDESPVMMFGKGSPLVIKQNGGLWALTPLAE